MAKLLPVLTCAVLTACVSAEEPAPVAQAPAPAPAPGIDLTLAMNQDDALAFSEEVAARCWLDTELQAAALIVDRHTRRFVIVGETEELVKASVSPIDAGKSRLTLTGPVIQDSARAGRLIARLRQAEATGGTAC